jgi:hypothetical protein
MTVILCHASDPAALWLGTSMRQLGLEVDVVTVEQLVFSRRIVFRMNDAGDSGSVELAGGRLLRPEAISGLINRVRYLPTQHFERAQPRERVYAESELSAFVLGWINGVAGRVINPPLPFDLGGGTFPPPTLLQLAAMAGLPTGGWRASADEAECAASLVAATHAVIVFDGRVFGPLVPRAVQDGCRGLASLLGTPLLQVELQQTASEPWRFVSATGMVDFRIGGRPLVKALAQTLATREAA